MTGAVIFDFDGILADTERLHWRAFQEVLAPVGLRFSWEEYVAAFIGSDDRDAFRGAYRGAGLALPPAKLEGLIRRKAAAFAGLARAADNVLYPGAAELVHACAAAGWRLAICSGARREDIETVLGGSDLLGRFRVVVTAEDVAVSKPDPESYHRAVRELGIRPAECIVVEDTPAGIAAARGAGLRVIGVTTTHAAKDLDGADRIVPSISHLSHEMLASVLGAAG